jgi:hypothetical protein
MISRGNPPRNIMVYGKFMVDSPLDIIPYRVPHDTLPFGKKTMARSRFHRQRLPNQVTVMGKKLPNWRGFVMIYSNQKATKKIDMV